MVYATVCVYVVLQSMVHTVKRPGHLTIDIRVIEQELHKNSAVITKVSETASKEFAIESALDKMQAAWATVKLSIEDYRETGGRAVTYNVIYCWISLNCDANFVIRRLFAIPWAFQRKVTPIPVQLVALFHFVEGTRLADRCNVQPSYLPERAVGYRTLYAVVGLGLSCTLTPI